VRPPARGGGRPGDRGPGDPLHDGGRGLRRGRLRGGGLLLPHLRPGPDHGQDGTAARLLPLSVDGLILAASLVLLHEARNGRDAPGLARFMLWLGIGATIGANIAYGAGYGLLGALISGWPAVAFIGSGEIAMQLVRRSRGPQAATAVPEVPGNVEQAVRAAYAASVAAGAPMSQRAMAERFGLSRRRISQLIAEATGLGNGDLRGSAA
jgi:hypothetical protein